MRELMVVSWIAISAVTAALARGEAPTVVDRPNIVLILADDKY